MSAGTNTQLLMAFAKLAVEKGPGLVAAFRAAIASKGSAPDLQAWDESIAILQKNPEAYFRAGTDPGSTPIPPSQPTPLPPSAGGIYGRALDAVPWNQIGTEDLVYRTLPHVNPTRFWVVQAGDSPLLPATYERAPFVRPDEGDPEQ